ncbi:hypothetical protein ElyMa_007015300 [Elysia marginata]|uniref:Uncharacterized protein n=1 Tax=Elysia marginata TaxID=1093978 RepID=A0AAV4JTA7_9GAST|nr:hypothetical protein ElyMa_007015300 [Elysia marginata]
MPVATNITTNGVKHTMNIIQIHNTDKTALFSLDPDAFVDCVDVEVLHSSVFLSWMMMNVVEIRTRQKQKKDGIDPSPEEDTSETEITVRKEHAEATQSTIAEAKKLTLVVSLSPNLRYTMTLTLLLNIPNIAMIPVRPKVFTSKNTLYVLKLTIGMML